MNCEQMQAIVLDMDRDDAAGSLEHEAALAHLSHCSRCAALQESWQAAREELRALGEQSLEARAPARVEMRLRQEFRTRHRALLVRRSKVVAAWALAAAAVLIAAASVRTWERSRQLRASNLSTATQHTLVAANNQSQPSADAASGLSSLDDSAEFTPLPGSTLDETEEASIFHVRMQRSSLGALGLPVNEERAGEWIQVDLLVGNDGLPQAVRLAEEED
jgi:hypothetical protein